jgi:hypothetical protein
VDGFHLFVTGVGEMGIIAQAVLGSLATFAPDQALQPVQPPALVSSDTGLQVDKAALRRNHVHGSAAPEAVTHVPFAFQAALAARLGMVQSPAATPPVTIPEMEKKLAELQAPAGRRNSLTDYFQQFLKTSARLDPQNSLYVDTRNSEREKLEKAVKGVCDTAEAQLLTAQQKYTSSNPRLAEHSRQQADGIVRSLQEQRASIASAFRESRYYQDNLRARNPSGSATASLPAAPNADDINFVVDRSLTVKVRVGATTQLRPGEVLIFKKDPLHPTKYATDELAQFLCDAAVARAAANQPTPKRLQIGNDSSITEQALKGQIAAAEKRVAAYVDAFERFRDDVRDDPALIGRVTDYAERTLQAAAETADLAAAAPHITAAEQQLAGVTRAITDGGNALRMTLQDDIRGQDVAARRIYDDAVDRDNSNAHVAQGLTTSDAYLSTVSEQIDSILSGTDTEAVKSQKLAALASSIIADKDKLLARSQSDLIERERGK